MIKRIINKETGMFLRDGWKYNPETEIALDVAPASGFYWPKWDGTQWVEGRTSEEIAAIEDEIAADLANQPKDPIEQLRADVDYIAILAEVEL